jgi:nucleoside 2-deoxyribosyltransferase
MNMYTIYFAGDLFDHKHLSGNLLLAQHIETLSNGRYKCLLPQNWEGTLDNAIEIRNKDIKSIMVSDLIILNFDGVDLDSGTVVELIIAKMLDIPAVLLRTDIRRGGYLFNNDWNLMVMGYPRCQTIVHDALIMYNKTGLAETHHTISQSVIKALDSIRLEASILCSYEEVLAAYQYVIKMCGGGLEKEISEEQLHKMIERKIQKGIYSPSATPPKQRLTQEKAL